MWRINRAGNFPGLMPWCSYEQAGGGGAGSGGDGGAGSGGGSGDEGGGGGSEGDPQPHKFDKDDALVALPGYDKPVSVADLRAAIQSREKHDGAFKTLSEIAKALSRKPGAPPKPQPKPQPKAEEDPIAALEKADLLDGKTLAPILRQLSGAQKPVQDLIVAMAKELKELKGHVSTSRQERAEQDFGGEVSRVVTALNLPKAAGMEILQDMARDLFLSYDPEDHPRLKGETFAKEFKARFEAARKYFRELEKADLEAARERQRKRLFTKPGANSSGNGKPKLPSNRQLADMLFDGVTAET